MTVAGSHELWLSVLLCEVAAGAPLLARHVGYHEGGEPEAGWAAAACEAAGTPAARGGAFAAVLTGQGRCLVATDLLGRQPLYYRLVAAAGEGSGACEDDEPALSEAECRRGDSWTRLELRLWRPPAGEAGWVQHCPRQRLELRAGESRVLRAHAPLLGALRHRVGVLVAEGALPPAAATLTLPEDAAESDGAALPPVCPPSVS
mmetsp:Transcript_37477/g.94706  ORF Transcript_37477/g.94706 Transcript_37477/m.94706 type:complete len:204 (+) Transcript_37477:50-661(+)